MSFSTLHVAAIAATAANAAVTTNALPQAAPLPAEPSLGVWLAIGAVLFILVVVVTALLSSYSQRRNVAKLQSADQEIDDVHEQLESTRLRLGRAIDQKNNAYMERNYVLTFLCHVLYVEPVEGWRMQRGYTAEYKGWEHCLYITPPERYGLPQISWHFATDEVWMLDTLGLPQDGKWDGTTTPQKYAALAEFFRSRALAGRLGTSFNRSSPPPATDPAENPGQAPGEVAHVPPM